MAAAAITLSTMSTTLVCKMDLRDTNRSTARREKDWVKIRDVDGFHNMGLPRGMKISGTNVPACRFCGNKPRDVKASHGAQVRAPTTIMSLPASWYGCTFDLL
jgi:hypothetical protein